MNYHGLLNHFIIEELYESALLLSEYLYLQTLSEVYIFYVLKTLQKLNHNERVIEILKNNVSLLVYEEIQKVYLVSLSKTNETNVIGNNATLNLKIDSSDEHPLNKLSLQHLFLALTQKEIHKRKSLIKSFKYDERNMEPLFILRNEKLLSKDDFIKLVESTKDKTLKNIYSDVFVRKDSYFKVNREYCKLVDEYLFFSPYQGYKMAILFYKQNEDYEIFKLAAFMLENYANSYFSPLILGLYYLHKKKYKDAKKCFYESIDLDKTQGRSWLFLGVSLSLLKERINAVSCFKTAKEFMLGSYKPLFYLAKEFAEINDNISALFYYKHTLKKKLNKMVFFNYVSFLFKEEKLKDMAKTMTVLSGFDLNKKEKNVYNILTFFYLLSRGKFEDAENIIKNCDVDWRYYICYGYLKHLMAKNDDAINFYSECMLECNENTNVITELIKLAYSGGTQLYDHDLVDYSVDVFDMLKIGTMNETCYF